MSDEKQNLIKSAFVYTQNGEWYKAIEEYRKILKLEPDNPQMISSIGDAYLRKGDDQDALDSYWHARELYMQQGNSAKVLVVEKKMAKLNPDRLDPKHKNLVRTLQKTGEADQLMQEGKLDDALAMYKQLIETEPANFSYREKLAAVYLENAQVTEAADEFRTIAQAHLDGGRQELAKTYAARAAELDPSGASQAQLECELAAASGDTSRQGELMANLAKSEHESGRHEEAYQALLQARESGVTGMEPLEARIMFALKRYETARPLFLKMHAAMPDDESLLEPLLTMDEQAKDWAGAVLRVDALMKRRSEDPVLLNRAARIHVQAGKLQEAVLFYMKLAGQALKEGKADVVLSYFNSILGIQPDNLDVLKKKAEILFKLGKKADCIAAYKEVEKALAHRKMPEEARKVAMLVNKIQSLPEHPSKSTLH